MGIAATLTGLVLARPGAGKDAVGDVRCYIVGPVVHCLEDVEPFRIGEHDAFLALTVGDVRTVDVLDGEQHLAGCASTATVTLDTAVKNGTGLGLVDIELRRWVTRSESADKCEVAASASR